MHLVHLALAEDPGFGLASEVQEAIIRSSLEGPALINALRVEPELGTPARGGVPATSASPVNAIGGGWRSNGHKIYCTGSHGLCWMFVWASVASEDPGKTRVGAFVVDAQTPGVEIRETWDHLGLRASASHDVILTDVAVPAGRTGPLEPVSTAWPTGRNPAATVATTAMTVLLSSLYLGVAEAARDRQVEYLRERAPTSLGAPLASLPRFQTAVGEIEASLTTAHRLLGSVVADLDAGAERRLSAVKDTGVAEVAVSRADIAATEQAVALIGNPGLSRHLPLQRHLRDAMCSRLHTPQDDSVALSIGRRRLIAGLYNGVVRVITNRHLRVARARRGSQIEAARSVLHTHRHTRYLEVI